MTTALRRPRPAALLRGFLAVACALLASCGDGGSPASGSGSGGGADGAAGLPTVVFARGADSRHLDPAIIDDGESVKVVTNLFDTLVAFEPGTANLRPGLAKEWSATPDGLTWTFRLREATFHDGSPVDAESVVWSFLRQKEEKHPAHVGEFSYWAGNFSMVKDVVATDPRTVTIVLDRPFAPFESAMALFSMSIVSKKAWESEGIDPATGRCRYAFARKPVGSGPYRFVRWAENDTIVLERNPAWWGGAPKVGTLIFKTIKDNAQRLLAVESGQADLMDGLNPQDAARVRKSADLTLVEQPGLNISYFAMNTRKKPYSDPRVRLALALAIDKETIRRTAYDGAGELLATPLPKGMPGFVAMEDRKRDIDRAKALLAEAGYPDGFKMQLWCGDATRTYMPRPKDVAIQLQQDFRKIGVDAEITVVEWKRYLPDLSNGRHEACLIGWMADYGDPDNFLYMLLSKETAVEGQANNYAFYEDDVTDGLLRRARAVTDRGERDALYKQAQEKIFADVPVVPLLQMPDMRVVRKSLRGYRIYPAGGEYLGDLEVTR